MRFNTICQISIRLVVAAMSSSVVFYLSSYKIGMLFCNSPDKFIRNWESMHEEIFANSKAGLILGQIICMIEIISITALTNVSILRGNLGHVLVDKLSLNMQISCCPIILKIDNRSSCVNLVEHLSLHLPEQTGPIFLASKSFFDLDKDV